MRRKLLLVTRIVIVSAERSFLLLFDAKDLPKKVLFCLDDGSDCSFVSASVSFFLEASLDSVST